ncbi:carboxynorspermidine decarboxylase, partial [Desulfocurvibacter africanus]
MDRSLPQGLDLSRVPTPCFVVDERLIERNLAVLRFVIDRTDCRILLALKGFAMWSTFPLIARSLHGCTASSPHEARLAREEFA